MSIVCARERVGVGRATCALASSVKGIDSGG